MLIVAPTYDVGDVGRGTWVSVGIWAQRKIMEMEIAIDRKLRLGNVYRPMTSMGSSLSQPSATAASHLYPQRLPSKPANPHHLFNGEIAQTQYPLHLSCTPQTFYLKLIFLNYHTQPQTW